MGQATEIFKDEERKREYDVSVKRWEMLYGDRSKNGNVGRGKAGNGREGEREWERERRSDGGRRRR